MANKISIILSSIILLIILGGVYWFKRGDACLTQPPYYNCYVQDKLDSLDEIDNQFFNWINHQNPPQVFSIDDNERIFTFEHIDGEGGVGWTRIMKNGEIKDSLGFYTNYIDPVLTPLSENTLIGSAWQWPQDNKLYNGPFFNYYMDFSTRQTKELPTKGRLVAKSGDGQKVVFLESECDKNPPVLEIDHSCNNQNLSLRLLDLTNINDGYFITHAGEDKLLDFNKVAFSPQGNKIVVEAKIESMDYDTKHEYWRLFIFDAENGQLIKPNNSMMENRYINVLWLDNENVIYW